MTHKQPTYTPTDEVVICPICFTGSSGKLIRSDRDVASSLVVFKDKRQEYLVCISLDDAQRVITQRIVTIGLLATTIAHPREIFAGPLIDRAASVIIAHNHPSGVATPSKEDIEMTKRLFQRVSYWAYP